MVNARMTSETGAMLPSRPMKCLRWRSMLDAAFGLRCYPGCYPETQFTSSHQCDDDTGMVAVGRVW